MTASVSGSKGSSSSSRGDSSASHESCTEIVPYNADKAARSAAGIVSDDEESHTVFDVSDSDDCSSDSGSGMVLQSAGKPCTEDVRSILPDKTDSHLIDHDYSESPDFSDGHDMVIDTNSSPEEEESESSDGSGDVISFASEPPKPEPVLHVTPKKQPVTSSGNSSNNTPVRVSPAEKPHSTTAPGPASRKRKSLSPPARETGPKQARLNKTITVIEQQDVDSGDEKKTMRGRRGKQFPPAGPASSKLVDQEKMKQLVADQARYPPQHEAGRCQEFKADEKRIKYFLEVMELKLKKYWNMNAIYWRDNGRVLHLAMPFPHFVEYYWPGQVVCCGRPQENARLLEKHIHRVHKPPRPPPSLSVISLVVHESSDSDDDADIEVMNEKEQAVGVKSKGPPGFLEDQNKFPPQHKPGEPEDFLANQESIDYFLDAIKLKREKYLNMIPIKDKPLSGTYTEFILHYWPGMMLCCDRVQLSCKDFQKHIVASHLPPQMIPQPLVTDMAAVDAAKASPVSPYPATNASRSEASPHLASPWLKKRPRLSIDPAPSSSRQDVTPVQQQPVRDCLGTPPNSMPFMEEARKLRAQAAQSTSLPELLPTLERILDMSSAVTLKMRSLVGACSSSDDEARANTVECLEYVWNASKSAILKWEDLKGRTVRDPSLAAVQYAYGSLPVFVNWEETKHLDMVESVILLCKNTVKQWAPSNLVQCGTSVAVMAYGLNPSATAAAVAAAGSKRRSLVSQTTPKTMLFKREPSPLYCSSIGSAGEAKLKNLDALVELCRLANVAVWQNTKSRPDFKDDAGNYHTMYRYGFKKMLDLYFPREVSQLKCCGKSFDRASLVTHVAENHESGCTRRTEPSISLP